MIREFSQEKREKIIFKLAEFLNFSPDEYIIKIMDNVSVEYARGYLEASVANARNGEIILLYQLVRTLNMA